MWCEEGGWFDDTEFVSVSLFGLSLGQNIRSGGRGTRASKLQFHGLGRFWTPSLCRPWIVCCGVFPCLRVRFALTQGGLSWVFFLPRSQYVGTCDIGVEQATPPPTGTTDPGSGIPSCRWGGGVPVGGGGLFIHSRLMYYKLFRIGIERQKNGRRDGQSLQRSVDRF